MKDKEPVIILIVLFILLGLAYGPMKEANQKNKNYEDTPYSSSIGEDQSQSINTETKDLGSIKEEIERLEEQVQNKIEESRRSPFFGKVELSSWISGLNSPNPEEEYMIISTDNMSSKERVNITGWYLKSEETGYFAKIGQASLLPFPFTPINSDIILKNGDRVILAKGFSPIGISFRTNKCTGYFEENRTFNPGLSLDCPRPIDEKLPKFSEVPDRNDECLDIIENIPRCTTLSSAFFRDMPDTVPSYCQTYIETQVNYNACVAKHYSDTNFPGNEYRIYLNKFGPLWRDRREKINLHDRNGLIVSSISY